MKRITVLAGLSLLLLSTTVSAQRVNTDSLSLVSKISKDQLKLGELQNQVAEKTKDKQDAAKNAQESADDNQKAANELSGNPQDKKLARTADRKAGNARSDANKARKAARALDDLNNDIAKQKEKIGKEQAKLNLYTPGGMAAPVAAISVDTTGRQ